MRRGRDWTRLPGRAAFRRRGDRSGDAAQALARRSCSTRAIPSTRFASRCLPSDGVGLARMEFVFAGWVGVHPLALTRYATLAPTVQREVDAHDGGLCRQDRLLRRPPRPGHRRRSPPPSIRARSSSFQRLQDERVRTLVGGAAFEPREENPMLGWRGASRYYHPNYKEGFLARVRRRASACARPSGSPTSR